MPDESSTNKFLKFCMVFGAGFALFWFFRPKMPKVIGISKDAITEPEPQMRTKLKMPAIDKKAMKKGSNVERAFDALTAYVSAYNAGEPQSTLDDLNSELSKQFSMVVYRRKADNKLAVKDLSGKDIIVNNE